ncbi:UBX domain-containing protein 4-like isoform X1 [Centruroides sculpturatus]|uniref:UBX domain-containing protein 4-like isoform X1 n=1 Tax=Centruroides sculpturatus TaxID=218467 RepID=UPI000C6E6642|nr:UBX domain-containing protein 4-like isoform X1 [Centruroides sculpturatus]
MHWYEGNIPEAISEAKGKKKIFLVYIEGDDDLSKQMNTSYDDQSVSQRLNDNECIAVKIQANSEACKQFSQIYPVVIIPSSFFIGNNGIPLEVIAGNLSPEQFLSKIDNVIEMHKKQIGQVQETSPASNPVSSNSNNVVASLNTETTSTYSLDTYQVSSMEQEIKPNDVEMADATNSTEENDLTQNDESNSHEGTGDDPEFTRKMKRARKLIEEKKIEREEEEKKKEKEQELERRKVGREVQKAQKEREISELKQWAEERAKEKKEEHLARERVLAQIAQDRAERAAKFHQMNEQKLQEQKLKQQEIEASKKAEQERLAAETSKRSQFANIQFRISDGPSVIHRFSADATLRDVQQFLTENLSNELQEHLGSRDFTLSTNFPRREFNRNDYSQTLRDLQLSPSATLLVLPVKMVRASSPSNNYFSFIWDILAPVMMVWSYIVNFFSPSTSNSTTSSEEGTRQRNVDLQDKKGAESERKQVNPRNNFYQEGNIYRLTNRQADDDENNTWNGNSTQQM